MIDVRVKYYKRYEHFKRINNLGEVESFRVIKSWARGKILDIGCGIGYITNYLGAVGIDVDKVCCEIMGIDPFHVEHLRIALEEELGSNNVEVVGESINSVRRKFRIPQESKTYLYLSNIAQRFDQLVYKISGKNIFPFLSIMFGKRPRIDQKKCVKCGICEKVCIVSPPAIDYKAGKISYRCIDCLLCMEQCPKKCYKR